MTFPEHLRATRNEVAPALVDYRNSDPRVVTAVRMLDGAADEIERLTDALAVIRKHADDMAAKLNAEAKRSSGKDNTVDYDASKYQISLLHIDRGEKPPRNDRIASTHHA